MTGLRELIIALLSPSSGERNPRDDILARLTAVLDEVGTARIRQENEIKIQLNPRSDKVCRLG